MGNKLHLNDEGYEVTGDHSGWHSLTPGVWRSLSGMSTDPLLSIADLKYTKTSVMRDDLEKWCFSSALQILQYGIAWKHIELGLEKWKSIDYDPIDPCLEIVIQLLGQNIEMLREFVWTKSKFQVPSEIRKTFPTFSLLSNSGGHDCLHLLSHSNGPLENAPIPNVTVTESDLNGNPTRELLVVNRYPGWYRSLSSVQSECKIDVYCTPVGWLGTYTHSKSSDRFHRTSNHVHEWGLVHL